MVPTSRVYGYVYNINGKASKGALVSVYLNKSKFSNDTLVINRIVETTTNTYGQFVVNLIPTANSGEYYTFLIQDVIKTKYNKIVPYSSNNLFFDDLQGYTNFTQNNSIYIGGNQGINLPIFSNPTPQPSGSISLLWYYTAVNPANTTFTAPGPITTVVLNGQIQTGLDYSVISSNTINFNYSLLATDNLAIQYQVI